MVSGLSSSVTPCRNPQVSGATLQEQELPARGSLCSALQRHNENAKLRKYQVRAEQIQRLALKLQARRCCCGRI